MIANVVLGLLGLCVLYVLYTVFISDFISDKREQWASNRSKQTKVDKIALVKLASNDPKDIEKFVTDNAEALSMETVKKLVARIESIRDDRIISADDMLRKRFEDLPHGTLPDEPEDRIVSVKGSVR